MANLTLFRRCLKVLHPQGIPFVGIYNWVSATSIFLRHYDLVADDILSRCNAGNILDVGTGPARLPVSLCRKSPKVRLTGIDITPSMVAKARANIAAAGLADRIEVRKGDASAMPFPDATFDAVVSTGSLHHWKQTAAVFDEIYRVLAPGGWAMIYDVPADTPPSVRERAFREFGRLQIMLLWFHTFEEPFYRERDLISLAQSSRFGQGTTHYVGVLCCLAMKKRE